MKGDFNVYFTTDDCKNCVLYGRLVLPRLCVDREMAASLFQVLPSEFEGLVAQGVMPGPCKQDEGGLPYWDLHDLRKVSWSLATHAALRACMTC